jgi:hypothetical protein
MVGVGVEGAYVDSSPGRSPQPWAIDGKDVLRYSGLDQDLAIQLQGLVPPKSGPSVSLEFNCHDAMIEGPIAIVPIGIFAAADAQHGLSVIARGPPGSGDLRFAEENGQRSFSWAANASLVLGLVPDGHGSGIKHVSVENSDGRKDWITYENADLLGLGDAAFFSLDWAKGVHTLTIDAAGTVALASDTDILFFDVSATCPTGAGCGLLVPPAAQPTA